MRRNVIFGIVFAFFMFFSSKAIAMDDYTQITQDYKLQQVLSLLKNHSDETRETLNIILGNNLSNRPIKIMFYNLSRMNIAYEKYDALTCKHKNGTLYIFINSIHRNAPIEALACLLAHETLHQDDESSYQEEVTAWTMEAKTWLSFKKAGIKVDNTHSLVKRLNTIEKMYVNANYLPTLIAQEVRGNAGYRGLSEYSPGYGI